MSQVFPVVLDYHRGVSQLRDFSDQSACFNEFDKRLLQVLSDSIPKGVKIQPLMIDDLNTMFTNVSWPTISLLPTDIYHDLNPDIIFSSSRFYTDPKDIVSWHKPILLQRDGNALEWQYDGIEKRIMNMTSSKISILDDGLASGSSVSPLINLIEKIREDMMIELVVGMNFSWSDVLRSDKWTEINIIASTTIDRWDLYDALETRDLFAGSPQSWASIRDKHGIIRWQSYVPSDIAIKKSSILPEKASWYTKQIYQLYLDLAEHLDIHHKRIQDMPRRSEFNNYFDGQIPLSTVLSQLLA